MNWEVFGVSPSKSNVVPQSCLDLVVKSWLDDPRHNCKPNVNLKEYFKRIFFGRGVLWLAWRSWLLWTIARWQWLILWFAFVGVWLGQETCGTIEQSFS
jgi:hypothetical protein